MSFKRKVGQLSVLVGFLSVSGSVGAALMKSMLDEKFLATQELIPFFREILR